MVNQYSVKSVLAHKIYQIGVYLPCITLSIFCLQYGFTLDRTVNDAISPYLEAHLDTCFLREIDDSIVSPQHPALVFLKMDFRAMR